MASIAESRRITPGSSHWGAFNAVVENGRLIECLPFAHDPDPSPLLRSIPDAIHHHSRVTMPAIREGWLKRGPGAANDGSGTPQTRFSSHRKSDYPDTSHPSSRRTR